MTGSIRVFLLAGLVLGVVGFGTTAFAAPLAPVAAVTSCSDLAAVDLTGVGGSGSNVTKAEEIEGKGLKFCAVEGVLAPSIGFKIELPVTSWTQRYLQVGCGGLCGNVNLDIGAADGCVPVTNGEFVVAATDMGHQGQDPSFGRDPQKRVDFAYRAQHAVSLASKALIKAFYGRNEAFSYFTGCSDGGREAMMEAQRYPGDFNGIVAGAPAMYFQFQNSLHHAWLAVSNTGSDGKAIFTAPRLAVLHNAVLAACDALDGLKDGLVSEPRLCHFDPKTIVCAAGATDTSSCLTPTEAEAARKFYEGPRDPQTGEPLTVGEEAYGSEFAWGGVFVPPSADRPIFSGMIAMQALGNLIFAQNPPDDFKLSDLTFDRGTVELLKARHPLFDAINPDLSAFKSKGGKLILWHGWADPHISPLGTIAYHEAVEKQMGPATVAEFERLYLLPGVYHCGQGEGMASVDLLTPMLAWVENGTAPDAVLSKTQVGGGNGFGLPTAAPRSNAPPPDAAPPAGAPPVVRSRPVFPYPSIAVYTGKGDPNDAANFAKGDPLFRELSVKWAGQDLLSPYAPAEK